jgi:cell filamentation protein, protein adenylyltransferase
LESVKPYNDLSLLPPKVLETKAVLRKAIAANKALAELKGAGDLIPNQRICF